MRILWIVLLASAAIAQSTKVPAPSVDLPSNWYGAGSEFSLSAPSGTSPMSGWMAYAHLLSSTLQTYQFDVYNVYVAKTTGGKTQIVTSTAAGFMVLIKQYGLVSVYAFGAGGGATGLTAGNSFPYGGLVDIHLGKTLWHLDVGMEEIPSSVAGAATQKSPVFGIGRTF